MSVAVAATGVWAIHCLSVVVAAAVEGGDNAGVSLLDASACVALQCWLRCCDQSCASTDVAIWRSKMEWK